jgi:plasmid stabilization system protein ParE
VAGSIELQWSDDALADLNRFAAFLHERSPELAASVADPRPASSTSSA